MGALFKWERTPEPALGSIRVARRLLLLPYELAGEYRWLGLERVIQVRKAVKVPLHMGFPRTEHRWVDVEWAA